MINNEESALLREVSWKRNGKCWSSYGQLMEMNECDDLAFVAVPVDVDVSSQSSSSSSSSSLHHTHLEYWRLLSDDDFNRNPLHSFSLVVLSLSLT